MGNIHPITENISPMTGNKCHYQKSDFPWKIKEITFPNYQYMNNYCNYMIAYRQTKKSELLD